jgi:hypothetical protein
MATPLPAQRAAIVNLYTALFNRAPDASGLAFWAQAYADGAPLAAITQSFLTTTEGRATYPASQTSGQFVAAFYQTVFGRPADADGLAFWTAALDAAGGAGSDAARAALAGQIVGIVSQPLASKPAGITDAAFAQTVADRALFANKIAVGEYVASLNINDVGLARQVLGWVTADPASVASAKNFAANGGVVVLPPDPPPMPTLAITNADATLDIVSKLAAYAGNIATVNATGMDASKLAAVAGGIAKIAGGGISGALGLSASDYAGGLIDTLATKLAASATVAVTATSGGAPIALKALQRTTTINGSSGNDTVNAVVDANTPANTTLNAQVTINGNANISDTLNIITNGAVGDALNGAVVTSMEIVSVYTSAGGSASIVADPVAYSVVATGLGDLTVTDLASTSFGLRTTSIGGNYHGTYVGTGGTAFVDGASANVLTLDGNLASLRLDYLGGASHVKSLVLGSNVGAFRIQGAGDSITIDGISGGIPGGPALTLTGSNGTITLSGIASAGTSVDGSTATAKLALTFGLSAGVVRGGTNSDTLTVQASATLTGNGGADLFAIRAGVGQSAVIDQASLTAKLVTITDFSAGDRISIETPVLPVTAAGVALQTFVGGGATLLAQTASVAQQMEALTTKVPYGAFTFGGASYVLADNGLNGLGEGDTLIKLTGSPDLARIVYENDVLTMT